MVTLHLQQQVAFFGRFWMILVVLALHSPVRTVNLVRRDIFWTDPLAASAHIESDSLTGLIQSEAASDFHMPV